MDLENVIDNTSLVNLVDNNRTDKNTRHSYLELYENLLSKYKYTATNILEIGIGPPLLISGFNNNGGSIKLWHDYFVNAHIWAVDIIPLEDIAKDLDNNPRIHIVLSDAYDPQGIGYSILKQVKFDFVLDDGPHTLESMIRFIQLYLPLVVDGGILIIEDVQDISWLDILKQHVPETYKNSVEYYDLRHVKGRYDDIVFVVKK
jgi:cephalosporin hydroxylase